LLRDVGAVAPAGVIVGLSGGKDSLVTLDLCVREFGADRVKAFHMYLVKGLDCVERTLRWCERRYKIEVLFTPHWMLGLAYKNATYMPHRRRADGWRDTKLGDIEQAVRAKLGSLWIAYGHRMCDSIERVGMLSRNGGLDQDGRRVYPLRSWNEAAVMAYLRAKRIPPPPRLTVLKRSMTGVSFQEDVLVAIRDQYPEDFKKIIEKFTYLPAKLARYEMKKKSWKQDTYVDKWKTSLRGR
jgi:3'-phosphoadenosine 5'-phosphosulfate sulfotransferase (PAPS reductase)/FAD synthetase